MKKWYVVDVIRTDNAVISYEVVATNEEAAIKEAEKYYYNRIKSPLLKYNDDVEIDHCEIIKVMEVE